MGRLPHTCVVPAFYSKKQKMKTNKGSTSWNTGEPKSFYNNNNYYYYFIIIILLLLFFYIFLKCSLNFLIFNSSKAKVKLQCNSSLDLSPHILPPLFMKVITQVH